MKRKTYAYARVSAQDQNVARQLDAFHAVGITDPFIYIDKESGKNFDRENYQKLLKKLKEGDTLFIKSIDRLGRNYTAIIEEWNRITNTIHAAIVVLDMPLLDTRTKTDSLVGKFISDIVLQILSFVAENERVNIRERQKEGIAAAKLRGVQFGRPPKVFSSEFISVMQSYFRGEMPLKNALGELGLKRSVFYYHAKNLKDLGHLKYVRKKDRVFPATD